jgi:hypothetical protein
VEPIYKQIYDLLETNDKEGVILGSVLWKGIEGRREWIHGDHSYTISDGGTVFFFPSMLHYGQIIYQMDPPLTFKWYDNGNSAF